jgi:hypothetical protein
VLVVYWIILFVLTSMLPRLNSSPVYRSNHLYSAPANPAHDQVSLRALLLRQDTIRSFMRSYFLNSLLSLSLYPRLSYDCCVLYASVGLVELTDMI